MFIIIFTNFKYKKTGDIYHPFYFYITSNKGFIFTYDILGKFFRLSCNSSTENSMSSVSPDKYLS